MTAGWETKTIADVFDSIRNGKSVTQDKSGEGVPVTRIETISNGSIDLQRIGYTSDEVDTDDSHWLEPGDILFSHINSPDRVGNVALYEGSPSRLLHGINLLRMRSNRSYLEPRFALHLLRNQRFRGQLRKFVNQAVNQASVNTTNLKSIEVSLPPLEEQKRIAAILDAADQLRTKRQQTIDRLSTLQAALFNKIFCVEKSSDWPIVPLGDLISTASGGTPSRKEPMFFQGEIPWVKSGEVKGRLVMESEEKISFEALTNSSAKLMPAGTVLLAMYGATVGAVSILGIEATTNQAVCCLTPTDQILGSYLADYLRSKTPELKRMAAGGAQPNISQQVVRQVPLLLAPIDAQIEYKLALEGIATAQSLSASSFENFDKLFNSLQQRAFRGDL